MYCGSLRGADAGLYELLGRADALVATVLAAGGTHASQASAGGDDEAWDIGALAELDVPVLQGLCLDLVAGRLGRVGRRRCPRWTRRCRSRSRSSTAG